MPQKSPPCLSQKNNYRLLGSWEVCGVFEHEASKGDEVEARRRVGQRLIVAHEAPEARRPGEGSLDDPLYNGARL
jgi:hypothetical protein